MLLRHPDLIRKGVWAYFKVARRLHLLGRFGLPATEQFMPMFILERPLRQVCDLLLVMNFTPLFHDCPPVSVEGVLR
jgi:hypothetical protein